MKGSLCTEKTPEPGEFTDILEERRRNSDLSYALRTFSPQPYKGHPPTSASALHQAVLDSHYLRYVTQEVATESGEPVDVIREEAAGILEEMSHNLQLSFIRLLGYTLSKVFKRVFRRILVNEEGLNKLQQAIQEYPVILMPNHRSYVDFLVLSYVLFTYDLSIPVIAAGIPLMGMKLIGEILRRSGAFFIRRAIGSDKLYWAVLSEYVKTIVRTGSAPLEFYVEGLRSRTLKSLNPKLGMMHMVLEPFFKGEVYDICLVPISISYDRVLEESLLAHELLGVPKPKESTTGLLKARKVLEDDYGSMHLCFGQPLSVRELSKGRISRSQYNLVPRDLPQKPSEETQAFVSMVAHGVVRLQERGVVLSPWSLMALVLLQNYGGLALDSLAQRTAWLRGLALKFGALLDWPAQVPDEEVMLSSVSLHGSLVCCEEGRVFLLDEQGSSAAVSSVSPEEAVLKRAAVVLMCASYRNQALHVFVRPALVAVAMPTAPSSRKEDVFTQFKFLQELFSNEFVFVPGMAIQDFEEGCSLLLRCGALQISGQELTVTEDEQEIASFLRAILQPFIQTYQVVFQHLTVDGSQVFTERQYIPVLRSYVLKLILAGELHTYEALSSDTQKNVLHTLLRMEAVTKMKTGDQSKFIVNKADIQRIGDILAGRRPAQSAAFSRL
ncbi:dihydroxyacetone phosphate acyltransferase-like isoform X1 [Alosa alosa]|uniref:dihydroxyacetone phosphate acyltransferase-like isoform X1 n=2 Tax=Alosa alosa TaxID=278164 RepID=UPI002015515B|nr:dihydroxyacetone phosphate acyltransferase-like isoform X1 [Alosa alosa]